jgi:predicted permease
VKTNFIARLFEKYPEVTQVVSIYLAKFLLMPSIAFAFYRFTIKIFPSSVELFRRNPLLLFILLLETCMPSAQNTTVILQLQGNKGAAGRLARTLMAIYVLGVPALSFWLIKILKLTNLITAES